MDYIRRMQAGIYTPEGYRIGRVVLSRWHSTASDTFCAVTIRRNHNPPRFLNAKIKRVPQSSWNDTDPTPDGTRYAGPVYVSKNDRQVTAFGQIGTRWTQIWYSGPNWVCWQYKGFPKQCGDLTRIADSELPPPPVTGP